MRERINYAHNNKLGIKIEEYCNDLHEKRLLIDMMMTDLQKFFFADNTALNFRNNENKSLLNIPEGDKCAEILDGVTISGKVCVSFTGYRLKKTLAEVNIEYRLDLSESVDILCVLIGGKEIFCANLQLVSSSEADSTYLAKSIKEYVEDNFKNYVLASCRYPDNYCRIKSIKG